MGQLNSEEFTQFNSTGKGSPNGEDKPQTKNERQGLGKVKVERVIKAEKKVIIKK